MADTDDISQRAHEIWEREGRPDGQSERHWREAAASLAAAPDKPGKKAGVKRAKAKAEKPAKTKPKAEKAEKVKSEAKAAKKTAADAVKAGTEKSEPAKKKKGGKGGKKAS